MPQIVYVDIYVKITYSPDAMHKTMVYLTEAQRAGLARYARGRRTSMARAIREAIDRLLAADEHPRQRTRFVGSFAGPDHAPVSERTEELLRDYLRRRPS